MESEKSDLTKRILSILPCLLIAGLVLVPVGIGFLCTINTTDVITQEENYMSCKDDETQSPCSDFKTSSDRVKCNCYWLFTVKQDILGDVTLYYELESFDQTNATYASSRDNSQFSGHPSMVPAESCGDFRYDEDKPIFPCGEVADSMFNDTFSSLSFEPTSEDVPVLYTGLLTEDTTATYRNPPAAVWANFTKPKSWSSKINNPWDFGKNTTGVENPAFRAWMNTDLKRKPVWRLDRRQKYADGIPAGNYTMHIEILYPVDKYNGSRKFILEGVYPTTRISHIVIGSIALISGILSLLTSTVFIFISKRNELAITSYNAATLPVGDRDRLSHRPRSNDIEVISEEAKLNRD